MLVLDAFSTFEGTKEASAVADRCPNLLFDTSLAYNADFIEVFAGRFGADRVVFGTDLYSPPVGRRISHVLGQLLDSGLSDADKALILGGNARRLSSASRPEMAGRTSAANVRIHVALVGHELAEDDVGDADGFDLVQPLDAVFGRPGDGAQPRQVVAQPVLREQRVVRVGRARLRVVARLVLAHQPAQAAHASRRAPPCRRG